MMKERSAPSKKAVRNDVRGYAVEKLGEAVYVLATHPGDVRRRLYFAARPLAFVPRAALPVPLREHFDWVWQQLTRREPPLLDPRPDRRATQRVSYTLHHMLNKTGTRIAERIVRIDAELRYMHQHSSP